MSDLIPKEHKPKVRLHVGEGYRFVNGIVKNYNLNTVCEEANCPNIHECWNRGTATIMIWVMYVLGLVDFVLSRQGNQYGMTL